MLHTDQKADLILFLKHSRSSINSIEDLTELTSIMNDVQNKLVEFENNSIDEKPLREIILKLNQINSWELNFESGMMNFDRQIEAIKVDMPLHTIEDELRYEVHRIFISYFIAYQRLEKQEAGRLARLEAFYAKLSERFEKMKLTPSV